MKEIYKDPETKAILLVDAENAFDNRRAAVHNKELRPSFQRYVTNTYQLPAKMIVNGSNGQMRIFWEGEKPK